MDNNTILWLIIVMSLYNIIWFIAADCKFKNYIELFKWKECKLLSLFYWCYDLFLLFFIIKYFFIN